MVISFEELGPESKVWIYQSDKLLSDKDQKYILVNTERFLREWTAHGNNLKAGVQILHSRFVVIGVDEAYNEASGCSIDKSVGFIRELGKSLNIDFLDRSKVALYQEGEVVFIPFTEIKNLAAAGQITADTKVFNHAVVTKKELQSSWLLPAAQSWIKRHFFIEK